MPHGKELAVRGCAELPAEIDIDFDVICCACGTGGTLAGIAAGWARWLEIRLNPRENPVAWQVASWLWPVCILFCGLLLLGYRET